jgi:hypothetical protein
MNLTAPGFVNRIAEVLLTRRGWLERIKRDAGAYLERLLRSNSTRVVFDLEQRVEVSRRKLESDLRFLLQQITSSAERALAKARVHQQAGHEAIISELASLDVLCQRLDAAGGPVFE